MLFAPADGRRKYRAACADGGVSQTVVVGVSCASAVMPRPCAHATVWRRLRAASGGGAEGCINQPAACSWKLKGASGDRRAGAPSPNLLARAGMAQRRPGHGRQRNGQPPPASICPSRARGPAEFESGPAAVGGRAATRPQPGSAGRCTPPRPAYGSKAVAAVCASLPGPPTAYAAYLLRNCASSIVQPAGTARYRSERASGWFQA